MKSILKEINDLNTKFISIKNKEWIESDKNNIFIKGNAGITFEKLIGLTPNQFEIPDYNGIEIKTKYSNYNNYIGLFNSTPDGPHYHEVERLKNKYGYPDSQYKHFKVLNCTIYVNKTEKIGLKYFFKLRIDKKYEKLFLLIYDIKGNLLEDRVYWDFDTLKEKLYRKMKYLAFIKADKKIINNNIYFKYNKLTFYKLKNFETFIKLIESGHIRISFKIGIYKSKEKLGKIYDHGTSFSIKEKDLPKLYQIIEIL